MVLLLLSMLDQHLTFACHQHCCCCTSSSSYCFNFSSCCFFDRACDGWLHAFALCDIHNSNTHARRAVCAGVWAFIFCGT